MNAIIDITARIAELGNMYILKYKEVNYAPFPSNLLEVTFYKENSNDFFKGFRLKRKSIKGWLENLVKNDCKRLRVEYPTYNLEDRFYRAPGSIHEERLFCVYEGYYEIWTVKFMSEEVGLKASFKKTNHVRGVFKRSIPAKQEATRQLMKSYLNFANFAEEINFPEWSRMCYKSLRELAILIENEVDYNYPDLLQILQWPFGDKGSWNDYPQRWAYENGKVDDFNRISAELYNSIHR